jgi:hypothetical protein
VRNAEVFRVGTGTSSPPAWVAAVRQPALEQQRLPRLQRLKQADSPVTLTLTTSKEARAIWTGHGLMGERNSGLPPAFRVREARYLAGSAINPVGYKLMDSQASRAGIGTHPSPPLYNASYLAR